MRTSWWWHIWPALFVTLCVISLGIMYSGDRWTTPFGQPQSFVQFWPSSPANVSLSSEEDILDYGDYDFDGENESAPTEPPPIEPVKVSVPYSLYPFSDPKSMKSSSDLCSAMCQTQDHKSTSKPCVKKCHAMHPIFDHLRSNQASETPPTLYIIPLDRYALLNTANEEYKKALAAMIHDITHKPEYLKWGGTDHAFLCITEGCASVMKHILNQHGVGRDSRMMWLGNESDVIYRRAKWPCPNRVLTLPGSEESPVWQRGANSVVSVINDVGGMLGQAVDALQGKKRWKCTGTSWNIDIDPYVGLKNGFIAVEKFKIAFCAIPKCGSSMTTLLLKKMLTKNLDTTNPGPLHSWYRFEWVSNTKTYGRFKEIINDPSWVKAVVVREPSGRFLSGYLDKIEDKDEYRRVGWKDKKHKPSLSWVISHFQKKTQYQLDRGDHHFRDQSSFCGLRYTRYDFMARVGTMSEDLEEFLKSMELWDKYGATGWGKNGTSSFSNWRRERKIHDSNSVVSDFYTKSMQKKVQKIYAEDYKRFGYSLDG